MYAARMAVQLDQLAKGQAKDHFWDEDEGSGLDKIWDSNDEVGGHGFTSHTLRV